MLIFHRALKSLEAYILKTKNDKNKRISDSEFWHPGYTWAMKASNYTNNVHA